MGNSKGKPLDYVTIDVDEHSIDLTSQKTNFGKIEYTMKLKVSLIPRDHNFTSGKLIVEKGFFKKKVISLKSNIASDYEDYSEEIILHGKEHMSELKNFPYLEFNIVENTKGKRAGHFQYKYPVRLFVSLFRKEFYAKYPGKNLTMIDVWGGQGEDHHFNYNQLDKILSGKTKIGYDAYSKKEGKFRFKEGEDASILLHVHAVVLLLTMNEFEDQEIRARFLKWLKMVSKHEINPLVLIAKADTQDVDLRKNPLKESKIVEEMKSEYRQKLRTKNIDFALPYITEKLRNFEIDCHNFLLIRDIYNLASDYYDTHENLMVDGSKKGLSKRSLNIAIIGPPGAGKSTTLQTFLTIFQDVEEVQYGRVTCAGAGHTTTRLHGYALVTREKDGTSVQEEN
mmetsp:Transcript_6250/g.8712  ORF Transcript_6250/g.8712 Transcript_6250/m.8712 type:complete len:396 (+) Transcript_6250:84-1271(+)|eukprot:CAMPEP_0185254468 /NCGR_PEP_ID=MMETSP1359-20130426/3272_1 /TAXON_ID=552665 /ORGANISM="Bigelowiella longifila, Strain CCMP242" /LENGTH=395 /DNA_ID=CAMNT_0027837503 /DNA_START=30 /DNA_END=1217 /DNA_ORIENTATION=-